MAITEGNGEGLVITIALDRVRGAQAPLNLSQLVICRIFA